jgi:hypothetical protein
VLLEFKYKDSDLIMGLKDIIADLTNQSKEKEARYVELQNKYVNFMKFRKFCCQGKNRALDVQAAISVNRTQRKM